MGSREDRFPRSQCDLLRQSDLANNWVSPFLSIERDTEAVEAREGEVSGVVVDTDAARREPRVSQQAVGFEAINYPGACGHLGEGGIAVLGDALGVERPGRAFAQFSCVAVEAGDVAAVPLLYRMFELL